MATFEWTSSKAISIMNEFKHKGLIGPEWTFRWNRRKNSVALCSFRKKEISFSVYYVEASSEAEVIDSALHEVMHAICGPQAGHGPVWQAMCRKYGAKPQRCSDREISIPAKYNGHCPVCHTTYQAHRKLKNQDRRLCVQQGCKAKALKKYVVWQ